MTIIHANIDHLEALVPLFDGYRVFYKQNSNTEAANNFLLERLKNKDSIIYIAFIDNIAVGFTQLYPLFSSVSMQSMYLLNDLYVNSNFRGNGIGEALINKAKQFCKETNQKEWELLANPEDEIIKKNYDYVKDSADISLFHLVRTFKDEFKIKISKSKIEEAFQKAGFNVYASQVKNCFRTTKEKEKKKKDEKHPSLDSSF